MKVAVGSIDVPRSVQELFKGGLNSTTSHQPQSTIMQSDKNDNHEEEADMQSHCILKITSGSYDE